MRWIFGSWFFSQLLIVFAVRVRSLLAKIPSFFSKLTHLLPMHPFSKTVRFSFLKFVFIVKKNLKFCFLKIFCFIISLTFYTPFSLSLWLTHLFLVHPFSSPGKHQKILRFLDVFRGQRKGALGTNGLSLWKYFETIFLNSFEPSSITMRML